MKPEVDQVEVTLLGPGCGECIVTHLGNNNWMVVDSCIDSKTSQPAALTYLESIGVNPSSAVKLVIATHWHDDHIRGLSRVLEECSSADFCCAAALSADEFLANVISYENRNLISGGSGVREIFDIFRILDSRKNKNPIRAITDRVIYTMDCNGTAHGNKVQVWALSPSDKQYDKFLNELTLHMPKVSETKRRAVAQGPNHTSVVTWVQIGDLSLLFGADLEETGDSGTGWSPIVNSDNRPSHKASIFKVPHHGSQNAHSNDVWKNMLIESPTAILTPYSRGVKKLPSPADIARIGGFAEARYSTSKIRPRKISKRSVAVEKTIRNTVGKLRSTVFHAGIIRLRNGGQGDFHTWETTLMNGACSLDEVYQQD